MHRFSKKTKPLHAMLAAAVLAVAVMPLAVAGATGTGATTSKVTDAKFKKLKQRIAALEAQGPSAPSGPAGGDLAGDYPNPQIGQNAVGTDEVANDSLTGADIADNAIGAGELANGSVGNGELLGDIVGNSALKPVVARVSGGTGSNNTFVGRGRDLRRRRDRGRRRLRLDGRHRRSTWSPRRPSTPASRTTAGWPAALRHGEQSVRLGQLPAPLGDRQSLPRREPRRSEGWKGGASAPPFPCPGSSAFCC